MVLFTRRDGNVIRVVINVLMPLQQLLLSESLLTEMALVRLLIGMDQHVRLQVSGRDRSVSAEFTAIAFFALVSLCMNLVAVTIWKVAVAAFTFNGNVAGVKLLNVNPQICFTSACGRAQLALEYWLFSDGVDHLVSLQWVRLSEASIANVAWRRKWLDPWFHYEPDSQLTLIRFLSSMNSQVPLQLERVRRRVGAVRTLIRTLACMTSDVSFKLAQLDACVIALRTLVRLLMSVSVTNMTDEFTRGCKRRVTELAWMGLRAGMGVNVVR